MDDFLEKPVGDLRITSSRYYTDDYKTKVFQVWYNKGKLPAPDLVELLPIPETNFGKKPSVQSLTKWIYEDFQERAKLLDAGVQKTMDNALIQAKVEMLKRHVEVAQEMQNIALAYLEGENVDMTVAAAVRLLVEGVRIERESVGIPGMLDKMSKKSDEELLDDLRKLIEESPVDFKKDEEEFIISGIEESEDENDD